jgi:hypothetical protein
MKIKLYFSAWINFPMVGLAATRQNTTTLIKLVYANSASYASYINRGTK